jgi:hypothetical protein
VHTFRDNAGRVWSVEINYASIKACRGLLGVDLLGLLDDDFAGLARLTADLIGLIDVLFVLCRDEAARLGVTDEDFGRALRGDALEHAADAFLADLADFFPNPRVRAGLRGVLAKGRRVRDLVLDHAEGLLAAVDPDSEARKLIASSGGSPGSSASTPAPSPSASST